MAAIVVVYTSEDERIVEQLVTLLRQSWDVWWAKDITDGDWEDAVRAQIKVCRALVPVMSRYAKGERKAILKDEMTLAKSLKKVIFPFRISDGEMPLGFGGLNYTTAFGWSGNPGAQGYRELVGKLRSKIGATRLPARPFARPTEMLVRGKTVRLPAFAFSLSSHETQVKPSDGSKLIQLLAPDACLLSAYDVWKDHQRDRAFQATVRCIRHSRTVLFLDSGNYEADRKEDQFSQKNNPDGWRSQHFYDVALRMSPDIAFSFDKTSPRGDANDVADRIVSAFRTDDRALRARDFELCPIVHVPRDRERLHSDAAPAIAARVCKATDPLMVAIPERELGDGLRERVKAIRAIRKALNALGKYYHLHLLGTGNPISMLAFAAAGADSFDGLEWCRTVADYENGSLFHFQHFDIFRESRLYRIQDPKIRKVLENPKASYRAQVACYNLDFFNDHLRSIQSMVGSGQIEQLLKMIPSVGPVLFKDLTA